MTIHSFSNVVRNNNSERRGNIEQIPSEGNTEQTQRVAREQAILKLRERK
jgi:hypothetical protein